jgi:hypothetical protein
LHVPELQNNLLSVPHLVSCHAFKVVINSKDMRFDQAMLHCRLNHHGKDLLKQAIKHGVADGLKLGSGKPLDTLHIPCIHGKHQHNSFPHQATHRSTTLLGRVHSNLHQIPVATKSGYCYWVTLRRL